MNLLRILLFISSILLFACQNQNQNKIEKSMHAIDFDAKLDSLGIDLPIPSKPIANYVNIVESGKLLFLAGKGPKMKNGKYKVGTFGEDLSVEDGYQAAKRVAELQLGVLKDHLGDLNRVKRIVKVLGLVRSSDEFGNQPEVMNGFSDSMVAVFGEKGRHARAAIGTNSLPRNMCIEIEMIVEVY